MRDPDKVMAYEAKQQRLVEDIMRSLHDEVEDDYIPIFQRLAKDLFASLCGDSLNTTYPSPTAVMVITLVNRPIMDSVGRDKVGARFAEVRHLQRMVFDKVYGAIASRITMDYQRLELGF
jgi:hypothetical protein